MKTAPIGALALIVGAAAIIGGCGGGGGGGSSSSDKATQLSMSISDTGKTASFQAPKTTKGGLVQVNLANKGQAPHGVQFIQYTGGHTAADVQQQLGSNSDKIPDWVKLPGGIGSVDPGASQSATLNLPAGNYVLVDAAALGGPSSGPPATAEMTVSSGENGDLPSTSGDVTANETGKDKFAWELSGLHTGQNDITFASKGDKSVHLIIAAPLKPDAPPDSQIVQDLKSTNGPPPSYVDIQNAQSTAILDGGSAQTTKLNLKTPGKYLFFCPLTDRDGGKPHFEEGLLKTVDIK
jgi:hypothetical protein